MSLVYIGRVKIGFAAAPLHCGTTPLPASIVRFCTEGRLLHPHDYYQPKPAHTRRWILAQGPANTTISTVFAKALTLAVRRRTPIVGSAAKTSMSRNRLSMGKNNPSPLNLNGSSNINTLAPIGEYPMPMGFPVRPAVAEAEGP